jgi:hypothetical protein
VFGKKSLPRDVKRERRYQENESHALKRRKRKKSVEQIPWSIHSKFGVRRFTCSKLGIPG